MLVCYVSTDHSNIARTCEVELRVSSVRSTGEEEVGARSRGIVHTPLCVFARERTLFLSLSYTSSTYSYSIFGRSCASYSAVFLKRGIPQIIISVRGRVPSLPRRQMRRIYLLIQCMSQAREVYVHTSNLFRLSSAPVSPYTSDRLQIIYFANSKTPPHVCFSLYIYLSLFSNFSNFRFPSRADFRKRAAREEK